MLISDLLRDLHELVNATNNFLGFWFWLGAWKNLALDGVTLSE